MEFDAAIDVEALLRHCNRVHEWLVGIVQFTDYGGFQGWKCKPPISYKITRLSTSLGVIIFNGILILEHLSYDAGTTEYTEGELLKYYLVQ